MLPRRPAAPLPRLSIRLMLVRPHGPYRLERQHVLAARQIAVAVLAFQPEINELTLPPGEVWSDSPFRIIRAPRRLHIIVACAEDPALAGSRLQIQKRAIPVGGDADLIGMEAIPFGAEGDIAPGAGLRRSISEPEVESRNAAAEIGIVVVAAQPGHSQLGIGAPAELPEVLQPSQQHYRMASAEHRVAVDGGALQPDLMGGTRQGERQCGV